MRWVAKALGQNVLSALPRTDRWNYVFQRHVTRTLPLSESDFAHKVSAAARHIATISEVMPELDLAAARFYEFGAGWDLVVPLAFFAFGVERQTVIDLRPNVRLELVNDALGRVEPALARLAHVPSRPLDSSPITSLADLERRFGIRYLAPADARATALDRASIDIVTSTETLEHIPADDIAAILRESRRILRPQGLFSALIDMQDHYSFFDRSISVYNYLRFSDSVWRLVNSDIHYQSRLRNSDYLALARAAGFEVVSDDPSEPSQDDRRALAHMRLARRFRGYDLHDLGIKENLLVLRKPHEEPAVTR